MQHKYNKPAGGIEAITSTLQHTFSEAGVIKGTIDLLKMNQRHGFDCPGCAWPEPSHRSITEFCENGAKALADIATTTRADAAFFAKWPVDSMKQQSDIWLNKQGRLTHPMIKREDSDHYEVIDWNDAFELIANHLNNLSSPDQAIFYTSGRTSNEAAYLYQLFVRLFGTNNLPDCSNMCHESSGVGLNESVGVGKGTVSLKDFELADAILVIGQNPGTNHPRMLTALQEARYGGCEVISINPLREVALERFIHPQSVTKLFGKGDPVSSMYLQVKIGGDIALLKGIMKELVRLDQESQNVLDWDFIGKHTQGFDAMAQHLSTISWPQIINATGLSQDDIVGCAQVISRSKRIIACWAMGLTQHVHGVANIQEVTNLMLMLGQIGKPGSGLCPVRGHSNVQGDRTMGIWEKPQEAFLRRLSDRYNFEAPRKHGYDTIESIKAMHSRLAKVFFAMGGNFLSASPDTEFTARALENCDLTVHVATKLNRAHLHTGKIGLLLPTLSRIEKDIQESGAQFVTVEDSMSVVHLSKGHRKPFSSELMSETAIAAHMAHATFKEQRKVDWLKLISNYDFIRDEIESVIPGFDNFNSRVRQADGFILPNNAAQRNFSTATLKANFIFHDIPELKLEDNQLLMMTIRSHDQFNTTVYSDNDRYRGVHGNRMVLFMNPQDMQTRGIAEDTLISITSHFNGETRTLHGFTPIAFDIPIGCTASYFPETNPLVPLGQFATKSQTPASKSIVISIQAQPKDRIITCQSCNKPFACGLNTKKCWCMDVPLSQKERDIARAQFTDCLCKDCLGRLKVSDADPLGTSI